MAWSSKLARPIALKGARKKLVTLRDAGEFLEAQFKGVSRHAGLAYTIESLMAAAEGGSKEDRERATEDLHRFLAAERLADAPDRDGTDMIGRMRAALGGVGRKAG